MKLIGMIGGLSWVSSLKYYRLINEMVNEQMGGANAASLLMYSVNTALTEGCIDRGDWDKAGEILLDAAKRLEAGGADFLIIASNTMHRCANHVRGGVSVPLLHIADATADTIKASGLQRIGLLGTKPTMEESFYRGILENEHGLDVLVPSDTEREKIHDIIFSELCRDVFTAQSKSVYLGAIKNMKDKGAEGIILGCTEIGLLVSQQDFPDLPFFDTTEIHCRQTVNRALSNDRSAAPRLFSARSFTL